MATNFFDRKAKTMPTKEINLPSYGLIVLEKMNGPKTMAYSDLAQKKMAQYASEPFPALYDESGGIITVDLTAPWCNTACMIYVMQKPQDWGMNADGEPVDGRYSFEQIVASSVTDEDDYNLLVAAVNEINGELTEVDPDPKALNPGS